MRRWHSSVMRYGTRSLGVRLSPGPPYRPFVLSSFLRFIAKTPAKIDISGCSLRPFTFPRALKAQIKNISWAFDSTVNGILRVLSALRILAKKTDKTYYWFSASERRATASERASAQNERMRSAFVVGRSARRSGRSATHQTKFNESCQSVDGKYYFSW